MSANSIQWIWSEPHQEHYYVENDGNGFKYVWSRDYNAQPCRPPVQQQIHPFQYLEQTTVPQTYQYPPQQSTPQQHDQNYQQQSGQYPRSRIDSGSGQGIGVESAIPANERPYLQGLIAGTPGTTERLDQTYYVRTGLDARRFFVIGRVFAMLYSEAAGYTSSNNGNDDAYSAVRFEEFVYSTIRRFVVVSVRQGFVYACGISTYSTRGTLKPGCVSSEHAVVYFTGTDPGSCYIEGERERGLYKDPIEVEPADASLSMKRESRIRFSKTIPVEMNVKVKAIGRVNYNDMTKLAAYWEEEFNRTAS